VANVDKHNPVYDAAAPESCQTRDGRTLKNSMDEGTDPGVELDIGINISMTITGQTNVDQLSTSRWD
jgi:hypothetical protein